MINVKITRKKIDTKKVKKHMGDKAIVSLGQAAAKLRLIAKRSIKLRPKKRKKQQSPRGDILANLASLPGNPPRSATGRLRKSILYSIDKAKTYAIIGASHAFVGRSGTAHEHGGKYRGRSYPKRQFMWPALQKIRPELPGYFRMK